MAKTRKHGEKSYYMISVVAKRYGIHPQTLRLYEREGFLSPSRTEGNTRLYSDEDLEQLEMILNLTRELGVNLAGVEVIINMRHKIAMLEDHVQQLMDYLKVEVGRRLEQTDPAARDALVPAPPWDLTRPAPRKPKRKKS